MYIKTSFLTININPLIKKIINRQRPYRKYWFNIVDNKKDLKIWWDSPFKREEPLIALKFLLLHLHCLIRFYKNDMVRKCLIHICGDTVAIRLSRSLCFLWSCSFFLVIFFVFMQSMRTSGETIGNGTNRTPLFRGLILKCLHYPVSINPI